VWPSMAAGLPMASGARASHDSAVPTYPLRRSISSRHLLASVAVVAGFEPAEGCPSRAFEFCGRWFRPVRLALVAPEPRLGSPLRTPLNLTNETTSGDREKSERSPQS
jgi:hypothetical protein